MSSGIKIGKNVALAVLSQIPVVSAFSKFCEDFVQDGWQERIDLWKEEVTKRLAQLNTEMEQKIRETSNFASILATAQRGALEDIEEDKVALYANAVINSIKNENIDDTKKHIFLNMLRDFTKLHIEMLKFFRDIEEKVKAAHPDVMFSYAINKPDSWYDVSYKCRPELFKDKALCLIAYDELVFYKLLKNDGYTLTSGLLDAYPANQTTPLAEEFLAFIAEQENANG